ncbi:MAG: transposase [Chloroflexi bacterium]|nr:transposase [Chloroflexota bacterium]
MQTRRSLRLSGYDYRQNGVYFVTICAYRHARLFGSIEDNLFIPNAIGRIIAEEWKKTAELRAYVGLDSFVVMPNHLHGIIAIFGEDNRGSQRIAPAESVIQKSGKLQAGLLGAIVGRFKGSVTRRVHELSPYRDLLIWQRNYYDHIIRNEKSLCAIREYITFNPARWVEDSLYIENNSDPVQC